MNKNYLKFLIEKYSVNKLKNPCKQSDGDSGNWSLTYTDKKGKKHRNCHTSEKNAQDQIAAIERPKSLKAADSKEGMEDRILEWLLSEINSFHY